MIRFHGLSEARPRTKSCLVIEWTWQSRNANPSKAMRAISSHETGRQVRSDRFLDDNGFASNNTSCGNNVTASFFIESYGQGIREWRKSWISVPYFKGTTPPLLLFLLCKCIQKIKCCFFSTFNDALLLVGLHYNLMGLLLF